MAASATALIAEYASTPIPQSPLPSPLTPISSPLSQIPSPSLHLLSPPTYTSPTYAEAPLGYRATMIRSRAASPSHVPSPLLLLPVAHHRKDILETDMPFRKRLCLTALDSRVDYGFIDTIDASIRASESRAITTVREVNKRVTDLATTKRQETHEL
ncbi:hypothetical protein Tco_1009581 [Tanacetum coccineum]|uniref:Uncharacterized protein n=1 Tax=Tanacetum coccineum TaxID=301880 RepID=A0ABQ4XUQ6_9ASTR